MLTTLIAFVSLQESLVMRAQEFLNVLNPDQHRSAVLKFEDEYRTNFRFVPTARQGVNLGQLSAEARRMGDKLLATHLSTEGLGKVKGIESLEDVLREMENNPGRDKSLYTYTFFGQPAPVGAWGWRFEGHHLSLNYTFRDGELISSSPQFLGSNPAEVRSGPQKGTRVLAQESDQGFALLYSLSEEQKRKAVLGDRTLLSSSTGNLGLVTGNDRIAQIKSKAGLAYQAMTARQRRNLEQLVGLFANVQRGTEGKRRLEKIQKAGWNEVVFAWMGTTSPSGEHYYRIQGPTFLIEFSNTQNAANHIHSVWRDFKGDFGRDVLGEHLASHHH